jgi:hypothetical protein
VTSRRHAVSRATICGIEVIATERAMYRPSPPPTTRPAMIVPYVIVFALSSVMTIAISMPNAEIWLPLRAVSGLCSCFRPVMKSTAATRYSSRSSDMEITYLLRALLGHLHMRSVTA